MGTGEEVTIRGLVEVTAQLTGFTGEIRWDPTKADGQPRRALDTSRAKQLIGLVAATRWEGGFWATSAWNAPGRGAVS